MTLRTAFVLSLVCSGLAAGALGCTDAGLCSRGEPGCAPTKQGVCDNGLEPEDGLCTDDDGPDGGGGTGGGPSGPARPTWREPGPPPNIACSGDTVAEGGCLEQLGLFALTQGDAARAHELISDSMRVMRALGAADELNALEGSLALAEHALGQTRAAQRRLVTSLGNAVSMSTLLVLGRLVACSARLLEAAGRQAGLLGTVHRVVGGEVEEVERTTPEAIDLQQTFARMLESGDSACVMPPHLTKRPPRRPRA